MYPAYAGTDVRYGLDSLVGMIEQAARTVRKQFPDAVLSMGQLSKPNGGEVDRHASHESGRDADVGFYVKSATGKSLLAEHMVPFSGDGKASSWPGAYFDDAKNWALVAAMLSDRRTRITYIFVATPIRQRLLSYAAKIGAPLALRGRAAEVLAQPRGALPHDDHFHVRIACPGSTNTSANKCIEWPMRRPSSTPGPARGPIAKATKGRSSSTAGHDARPSRDRASTNATEGTDESIVSEREEPSRSGGEASIPSLAPSVPGLGSVVIPASLDGAKQPSRTSKNAASTRDERARAADAMPSPSPSIVDDPDGVLEER